jgi:hypothetical protein
MYQKNFKALKKAHPLQADWLKDTPDVEWVEKIKSKNGAANLLINGRGRKIPLYDMNNPLKHPRKYVSKMVFENGNVTVLIGMGLGYLAKEILKKKQQKHFVVVIEPVAQFINEAFKLSDFSRWIANGSLLFASPTQYEIAFIFQLLEEKVLTQNWYMVSEPYVEDRPQEYLYLTGFANNLINQLRCNTGTISGSGDIMAKNDIDSVPFTIARRGIEELRGLYKGKPAITVSTGPSLSKNIHLLRDIQDKVIIIAVGQALRVLLAYDIKPDFACTVDFGETNMTHYKGLMDADVPLVALNRTYAPLLKTWQGNIFISSPGGYLQSKGTVEQGGSVAHLCFSLAKHLGCKPIIMIGQDLALTDNKSHIGQVDANGYIEVDENNIIQWHVTDPRSHLYGKKYEMGTAIYVPGFWGNAVLTNVGLLSFITAFENLIKVCPVPVINCTEGGAYIKGSQQMMLYTAINKYCKKSIDKSKVTPLLSLIDNIDELVTKTMKEIMKDIKILNEVLSNTKLGLITVEDIYKLMADKVIKKKALDDMLQKNFKYSVAAKTAANKNLLLGMTIFGAQREMQAGSLTLKLIQLASH